MRSSAVGGEARFRHSEFRVRAVTSRPDGLRPVAHDLALDQVDHVLGDVGGVVGDALQVARRREQRQARLDQVRATPSSRAISSCDDLAVVAVHLVVHAGRPGGPGWRRGSRRRRGSGGPSSVVRSVMRWSLSGIGHGGSAARCRRARRCPRPGRPCAPGRSLIIMTAAIRRRSTATGWCRARIFRHSSSTWFSSASIWSSPSMTSRARPTSRVLQGADRLVDAPPRPAPASATGRAAGCPGRVPGVWTCRPVLVGVGSQVRASARATSDQPNRPVM